MIRNGMKFSYLRDKHTANALHLAKKQPDLSLNIPWSKNALPLPKIFAQPADLDL